MDKIKGEVRNKGMEEVREESNEGFRSRKMV